MALINVDVELMLIFLTTIFFTLLYFLMGRERNTKLVLGSIGTVCWLVQGLTYVATDPEFPAVGLLFFGIGIILIVATIYDSLQQTKEYKEKNI